MIFIYAVSALHTNLVFCHDAYCLHRNLQFEATFLNHDQIYYGFIFSVIEVFQIFWYCVFFFFFLVAMYIFYTLYLFILLYKYFIYLLLYLF